MPKYAFLPSGSAFKTALPIDGSNPGSATLVTETSQVAFNNATLDDLADYTFVAYRKGGEYAYDNAHYTTSKFVTPVDVDNDGHCDKIVFQFSDRDKNGVRTAVLELTGDGNGNILVRQIQRLWNASSPDLPAFSVAADGTVQYIDNGGGHSTGNLYNVRGLVAVAKKAAMNVTPILVWTKKNGVLTLNDLAGAKFTNADGSWKKSAFVQFAAADNGVLTLQKVRRKHSLDGNANTQFFVINGDGTVDYSILPGNGGNSTDSGYDIHGLKVYPGFVQTTAALVFKGATLNDLETAQAPSTWARASDLRSSFDSLSERDAPVGFSRGAAEGRRPRRRRGLT